VGTWNFPTEESCMPHARPPLVVVGASAGGVEALRTMVGGLPPDFAACVLVVLHVPATGVSALPVILDRAGPLPSRQAVEGDRLEAGQILVARPDHHLIVADGHVTLSRGPQENGHRPAVDVLFRSAARASGERVVGVVLSGTLDDGAAGMVAVVRQGGTGVVQAFDDALYDGMPRAAAEAAGIEVRVPAADLGDVLVDLVDKLPADSSSEYSPSGSPSGSPTGSSADSPGTSTLIDVETALADLDPHSLHDFERPGVPAGLGCPDCHGALFEIDEGGLRRYRCRVGHAWSPESLVAQQTIAMESALWMALRSLEEKAVLNQSLAERAGERGDKRSAERFTSGSEESLQAAELVRRLIAQIGAAQGGLR